MATGITKKGMTQRHTVIYAANGLPVDLTGRTLTVKLSAGSNVVTANSGLSPQSGETLGGFWFEVTASDLAALGLAQPVADETFSVHLTLLNADTSLFAAARGGMLAVL